MTARPPCACRGAQALDSPCAALAESWPVGRARVADLVEESGGGHGQLETARCAPGRPGDGALLMSNSSLSMRLGGARAVQQQRPACGYCRVNGAGDTPCRFRLTRSITALSFGDRFTFWSTARIAGWGPDPASIRVLALVRVLPYRTAASVLSSALRRSTSVRWRPPRCRWLRDERGCDRVDPFARMRQRRQRIPPTLRRRRDRSMATTSSLLVDRARSLRASGERSTPRSHAFPFEIRPMIMAAPLGDERGHGGNLHAPTGAYYETFRSRETAGSRDSGPIDHTRDAAEHRINVRRAARGERRRGLRHLVDTARGRPLLRPGSRGGGLSPSTQRRTVPPRSSVIEAWHARRSLRDLHGDNPHGRARLPFMAVRGDIIPVVCVSSMAIRLTSAPALVI